MSFTLRPRTYRIGGRVGLKDDMNVLENRKISFISRDFFFGGGGYVHASVSCVEVRVLRYKRVYTYLLILRQWRTGSSCF